MVWNSHTWYSPTPTLTSEISSLSSIRTIAMICKRLQEIGSAMAYPRCHLNGLSAVPEERRASWNFRSTTYTNSGVLRLPHVARCGVTIPYFPRDIQHVIEIYRHLYRAGNGDTQSAMILKFFMRWGNWISGISLRPWPMSILVCFPRSLTVLTLGRRVG